MQIKEGKRFIKKKTLKNDFGALIKRILTKILYWERVKSNQFNFLKIKMLLNPIQTYTNFGFLNKWT